jgi:eukaryotic-like serine/threonine-protein kinase
LAIVSGTKLGPYEILTSIGSGGMGRIFRARDVRLDREVAIKVLPEQMVEEPEALSRFQQETKIVAALSHPNILTIFDCGIEQNTIYAVTELLEGEVLRAWLQRGQASREDLLQKGIAIAEGLAAAHSKGIVHRDLKPENIFITNDGRLKILDFGLAFWKPEAQNNSGAQKISSQTQPGAIIGTIHYLSPEQARGEELDQRSDLFSFGCLLYEMAVGKHPFVKNTAAETLAAILRDEPDLAALHASFPALVPIVERCLQKAKEDRFENTQQLVQDLKLLLGSSAPTVPWSPPSKNHATWIVVIALISLLLFAGGSWFISKLKNRTQTIAVLPFQNESSNAELEYLSDGIADNIINSISRIPRLRVIARSTAFKYKGKNIDPHAIGKDLNVSAILEGSIIQHGQILTVQAELISVSDGSQIWGQQYQRKPDDILLIEEEIARQISQSLRIHLTGTEEKLLLKHPTDNAEAYQLYLKGRYYLDRRTEEAFHKAVDYFQDAIRADSRFVLAYTGLADAYYWASNLYLSPTQAMPKAKENVSKALAIDSEVAEVHTSLALINTYYDWNFPVAELEYKRAIELNPGSASAHQWYGRHLLLMGRFSEATEELKIAQELDPLSLSTNVELGLPFYFQRDYDGAIERYRKALEIDSRFSWAHLYMAQAYEQKQDFNSAIHEYEMTGDTTKKLAGLGYIYARTGKQAETRNILTQLQALSKSHYVSSADIATIYLGLRDYNQAFSFYDQALSQRDESMVRLKINPRLDPLRKDPRFLELLKRVGF